MLLSRVAPSSCVARPSRARTAVVRASTDGAGLPEGTKVKVTTEIKVYHAPKRAEGIDLQGMQGTIAKNTIYYKDKVLSPNLPYKVQFELDPGAKAKFFAHLSDDEFEVVQG